MGIKRKGDWFDGVHVPKAKSRYAAAVKSAAMEQMLTPGEVEARVNGEPARCKWNYSTRLKSHKLYKNRFWADFARR